MLECCLLTGSLHSAWKPHTVVLQTALSLVFSPSKDFASGYKLERLRAFEWHQRQKLLTSPIAASSVPAREAGDLTVRECVSTIHSPARAACGELVTNHNRPAANGSKGSCMNLMAAFSGPVNSNSMLPVLS